MSSRNPSLNPSPSARRLRLVIVVSVFLNFMGFTVIIPVIPFLVGQFTSPQYTAWFVGLILSTYALCAFVSAPILGSLSDRYGRRLILLVSLAGSAVGYLIFGIGGAMWVLFVGRIVEGITAGNISTLYALVADVTPPQERGRVYGLLGAAGGVGFMVGPALGGLFGELSLAMPLFAAAVLSLVNMLWVYRAIPGGQTAKNPLPAFQWSALNPFAALRYALHQPSLRLPFAAVFLFCLAGTMLQSNLSVFMKDLLGFGPAGIGATLFVVGLMDLVSQGFVSARLSSRIGGFNTARWGLLINAVGALMIASVAYLRSPHWLFVAVAVFVLGDGLFQPAISGVIANATPENSHGRVQGANMAQQSIARLIGPLGAAAFYGLVPSGPYLAGALAAGLAFALLHTVRASAKSSLAH